MNTNAPFQREVEWKLDVKSWLWTLGHSVSRSVDMDDVDELVIRLCTQIGTIMEDTSIVALTIRGLSGSKRAEAIAEMSTAADHIWRLIEATRVLSR